MSEQTDKKEAKNVESISTTSFFLGSAAMLSLGVLYGIRRAVKEVEKESPPSSSAAKSPFQRLSVWKVLHKNTNGVTMGARAFAYGSLLCFGGFYACGSLFMYANNLRNLDEFAGFMRVRMKRSVLGRMIKTHDDKDETEEAEKWLEENVFAPTNKEQAAKEKKSQESIDKIRTWKLRDFWRGNSVDKPKDEPAKDS